MLQDVAKSTPDQDERDPQRYTFGCITPKGMTLTKPLFEPFLIEEGAVGVSPIQDDDKLRIIMN